jgi:hypothetical protein
MYHAYGMLKRTMKIDKKKLVGLMVVGGAILLGVGLFAGRNFIADASVTKVEQDKSLSEVIDQMMLDANGELVKSGTFVDADPVHKGDGMASVYKTDNTPVLILEDDFSVTNGPDLVVYLSKNNVAAGEDLGDFVSLGNLQSASGKQAYSLPEDYADFTSVVIWCRAFGVLFSSADLAEA